MPHGPYVHSVQTVVYKECLVVAVRYKTQSAHRTGWNIDYLTVRSVEQVYHCDFIGSLGNSDILAVEIVAAKRVPRRGLR